MKRLCKAIFAAMIILSLVVLLSGMIGMFIFFFTKEVGPTDVRFLGDQTAFFETARSCRETDQCLFHSTNALEKQIEKVLFSKISAQILRDIPTYSVFQFLKIYRSEITADLGVARYAILTLSSPALIFAPIIHWYVGADVIKKHQCVAGAVHHLSVTPYNGDINILILQSGAGAHLIKTEINGRHAGLFHEINRLHRGELVLVCGQLVLDRRSGQIEIDPIRTINRISNGKGRCDT